MNLVCVRIRNVPPDSLVLNNDMIRIIGCNLSFTTPVGTAPVTMTLVGGYRFMDYVKVGGPLNVILLVATIFLIPLIYGM